MLKALLSALEASQSSPASRRMCWFRINGDEGALGRCYGSLAIRSSDAGHVARIASEVRAAMGRLPGLQHNHQGIDRAAGTVAAVSVWDSEEHARFSREVLGEPIGRLRALGVQFEDPEIYEIMDSE